MNSYNNKQKDSDFIRTWDDIFGYDIASLHINDEVYSGYFDKSPIEARLIKKFNYFPVDEEFNKPYRAHWLIFESKLELGYVNGIINGVKFYTTEIVPEFPNEGILFHYEEFSGLLKFSIQKRDNKVLTSGEIDDFDVIKLSFENGMLIKMEFQSKQ
jgi:hypothetical protein